MSSEPATPERSMPRLNWGALALTPLWLFRNGFLILLLVHAALAIIAWPLAMLMSLVFFVWGTQWSWGNGRRWESFDEFADSYNTPGVISAS